MIRSSRTPKSTSKPEPSDELVSAWLRIWELGAEVDKRRAERQHEARKAEDPAESHRV